MVLRAADHPTGMTERVRSASEHLEELARAQGRGAPALRNADGQVLELVRSAQPLLTPQGIDSGVQFGNDAVTLTSGDGQGVRDLVARDVGGQNVTANGIVQATSGVYGAAGVFDGTVSGSTVQASGTVSGTTVQATGSVVAGVVSSNGGMTAAGQLNVQSAVVGGFVWAVGSSVTTVTTGGGRAGSMESANMFANVFYGTSAPSERRLKDEVEPVADGLERVEEMRPARWRWKDETRDTDAGEWHRVHVGIYVDELPDEAVIEQKKRDPLLNLPVPNGEKTYDDRAVIAYLVSAVQTLSARVRELEDA